MADYVTWFFVCVCVCVCMWFFIIIHTVFEPTLTKNIITFVLLYRNL